MSPDLDVLYANFLRIELKNNYKRKELEKQLIDAKHERDIKSIKKELNKIENKSELFEYVSKAVDTNIHQYKMQTDIDYQIEHSKADNMCECGSTISQFPNERVCTNCGLHYGYGYATEYINFFENKYKIYRKSVYKRKYHIDNMLFKFGLDYDEHTKFLEYFKKVEIIKAPNKKRSIKFDFIFMKIFEMMKLPDKAKICKVVKSKCIIKRYEKFWANVISTINQEHNYNIHLLYISFLQLRFVEGPQYFFVIHILNQIGYRICILNFVYLKNFFCPVWGVSFFK